MAKVIASPFKGTMFLRLFGWSKVHLIYYVRPKVVEMTDERVEIKIPLNWKTRNHWGSMYFGTLAIGADCAAGIMAMALIRETKEDISFLFKDVKGEFHKRADGHSHFSCEEGPAIAKLVEKARHSGQRENLTVPVKVTVPKKYGDEAVATFELTLSIKKKSVG